MQERYVHRVGPRRLVTIGFACMAAGILGMFGALGPLPMAVAPLVWSIAGFGIGLSYSALSVIVLGLAEPGREGSASSSLQLTDVLGVSLGTGIGGAFVALGESRRLADAPRPRAGLRRHAGGGARRHRRRPPPPHDPAHLNHRRSSELATPRTRIRVRGVASCVGWLR